MENTVQLKENGRNPYKIWELEPNTYCVVVASIITLENKATMAYKMKKSSTMIWFKWRE